MPAYLIKSEIDQHAEAINAEFNLLFKSPRVIKHNARQWNFFRSCFAVLMGDRSKMFACQKGKVIGYKHEISEALREYYSKPHARPIRFKFALEDRRNKDRLLGKNADYTCAGDYLLLVIPTDPQLNTLLQVRDTLCRSVDDAIHVEFAAYASLPEDLSMLEDCFVPLGPAFNKIAETVKEHRKYNETLANLGNPSTRPQLRKLDLVELKEQSARVKVTEYWNLHWLSISHNVYARTYQGQNSQHYTLVKNGSRWLVQENSYKRPRGWMP